ncbi:hypothetical protein FQR65_LT15021 [Abscondita terminalis]|nr:hypothetical protein FQR65_LT15021 [Abscondita terminalis]
MNSMPTPSWCVVQTQEQGRFVLSCLPHQWVSGSNLYWPNVKNNDVLTYLLKDGNSVPLSTWNRMKCSVKRNNCKSYEDGESLISDMSDASNTDSDGSVMQGHSKKRALSEINMRTKYSKFIKTLHKSENVNVSLPRRHIQNNDLKSVPSAENDQNFQLEDHVRTPTTVVAENLQCQGLMQRIEFIDQESKSRHEELLKILAGLETKVERLFTTLINNTMTEKRNTKDVFDFKPIHQFKQKFIDYMQSRCVGLDNSVNKMYTLIDCFFTRKFQNQCTWTGSSPKGPKQAIMVCKNVCAVFLELSRCETELISQTHVEKFFKEVLKNSLKRMERRGIRRSTKHHVAKKPKESKLDGPSQISNGGHLDESLMEGVILIDEQDNEEVKLNHANIIFQDENGEVKSGNYFINENSVLKKISTYNNEIVYDTDDSQ